MTNFDGLIFNSLNRTVEYSIRFAVDSAMRVFQIFNPSHAGLWVQG